MSYLAGNSLPNLASNKIKTADSNRPIISAAEIPNENSLTSERLYQPQPGQQHRDPRLAAWQYRQAISMLCARSGRLAYAARLRLTHKALLHRLINAATNVIAILRAASSSAGEASHRVCLHLDGGAENKRETSTQSPEARRVERHGPNPRRIVIVIMANQLHHCPSAAISIELINVIAAKCCAPAM